MKKILVLLLLMMPLMFGCAIKIFAIVNQYPALELISINYDRDSLFIYEGDSEHLVIKEFMSDTKDEYRAQVNANASALSITAGKRPIGIFRRYMEVYLPKGFTGELVLETTSGSIEISGISASKMTVNAKSGSVAMQETSIKEISVSSTSGSIDIKNITGKLTAESESGSIDITAVTGEASVKSRTGSIYAGGISGRFRLVTVSGAVNLEGISGSYITMIVGSGKITGTRLDGQIDLSAGSGGVELSDITGKGNYIGTSGDMDVIYREFTGNINMETGSGTARLVLPKSADFNFNARTINGSINSPFSPPERGTVGQGTHKVNMSSSSGNVKLELY